MISVIIPYKNANPWIERCAESLKNQTGEFEFVFVNDSSTDDGAEKLARVADRRFLQLDNQRGAGVSGARNTGMDAASGRWITFLDADDEFLPGAYDTFLWELDMADADVHQFNHMRYYTKIDKLALKYTNAGGWYDLSSMPVCWWGAWNKLYRAEFVKDIRFDESLQYGEDGMFNLECIAKCGRIHHAEYSHAVVKHRFDNPQSLSHVKNADDVMKQVRAYEDFMMRQNDPAMRAFMRAEMSRLWTSPTFERIFG